MFWNHLNIYVNHGIVYCYTNVNWESSEEPRSLLILTCIYRCAALKLYWSHHCSLETNVRGFRGEPLHTNLHSHERVYKHLLRIFLQNRNCYRRNYLPTNQEKFWLYPQTLIPTNKNESTVYHMFNECLQQRIVCDFSSSYLS